MISDDVSFYTLRMSQSSKQHKLSYSVVCFFYFTPKLTRVVVKTEAKIHISVGRTDVKRLGCFDVMSFSKQ